MSKKLVICGTGTFGQLARDYFDELSDYDVVAFASDPEFVDGKDKFGLPHVTLTDIERTHPSTDFYVFVAIGYVNMNRVRERVFRCLEEKKYRFASFVHPNVKIWNSTYLGKNIFIFEDNTIQPYTSIGNNSILWSGNHLGHHSRLGSHCFVSSHVVISGNCDIGNNVFFGVNSTLHDGVTVGDYAMIGSSTLVTKALPEKGVLINTPTKLYPRNSDRIGV